MTAPSPAAIVDIAVGYMGAKQLFAARRIGLFEALADGPLTLADLSTKLPVSQQMTRILADAMNSLGLLDRADGTYRLTAESAAYLTGEHADLDLGDFLAFLNDISYGHWLQFDGTVDTTEPGTLDLEGERWNHFLAGVMNYNALHARMLVGAFDFGPYRSMLDLGGLASGFSVAAMQANPDLHTTFVFDPAAVESVVKELAAAGLTDRAEVIGADTPTAQPVGDHDLVMVNHVVHRFDAEQNAAILRNARGAARTGARLVLLDFFLDDDARQRRIDALHAGEYLVIDGTIVYPESEVRGWLEAAGWAHVDTVALPGCPRILVAEAR
ncbi:methyltransferase [Prescottella subtropica]|uniref:methyltransferase n=1 Tax=Prescottella subtropica TaxID=2545757 RepID=UPI0010F53993|nr:methyltransferase [Prescottella subtropica]